MSATLERGPSPRAKYRTRRASGSIVRRRHDDPQSQACPLRPHFGGYLVAAWLTGIIVNLLMMADYYDIALRDFGLVLAALTLARLAAAFPSAGFRR